MHSLFLFSTIIGPACFPMTCLPDASKYSPIPYGISSAILILLRALTTFRLCAYTFRVNCYSQVSQSVDDGIQLPMTGISTRHRRQGEAVARSTQSQEHEEETGRTYVLCK